MALPIHPLSFFLFYVSSSVSTQDLLIIKGMLLNKKNVTTNIEQPAYIHPQIKNTFLYFLKNKY